MNLESQPVRYTGTKVANTDYHDGQLRPVVGVQSHQVLRANRSHPDWAEGSGWTYNHAPMLACWNGRFYLEYLSNPVDEHGPPGHTLLTSSPDGIHWERPTVVFPRYKVPDGIYQGPTDYPLAAGSEAVMHQRMGFFVSPDGRLLVLGFYGISPATHIFPNDGRGIGRVVREVYDGGSFGPIFFVRYNRHAGWNEGNTHYPYYKEAKDSGFVESCEALLADKLVTLQWWEEDRSTDGFYAAPGYKALSYYHLDDGRVVALWKWSKAAISADEGKTWSPVADVPSLIMAGGKIWGQRTSDDRYALVYNPTPEGNHRWPLAVVTGENGIDFDNMLTVEGEAPPLRFQGAYKDFGLNYVRGIVEGNGTPTDGAMWLTYSMNKEDIWVSRVPVPIRSEVDEPVRDTFNELETEGIVTDWNIYSSQWASVSVVAYPDDNDKSLALRDQDPYDYARAMRVFPESTLVQVKFRIQTKQNDTGQLFVEITDHKGSAPMWLVFDAGGFIRAKDGGHLVPVQEYAPDGWYDVDVELNTVHHTYRLSINGELVKPRGRCAAPVRSVERLVFRTGPRRREPTLETETNAGGDLPSPDDPVAPAVYHINYVEIYNFQN